MPKRTMVVGGGAPETENEVRLGHPGMPHARRKGVDDGNEQGIFLRKIIRDAQHRPHN